MIGSKKPFSIEIENLCRRKAEAPAIMQGGVVPVTFSNFLYTVHSFADRLLEHGVRGGDVVAAPVQDPIAVIAMKLALIRIGAIAIAADSQTVASGSIPGVKFVVVPADDAIGHSKEIVFRKDWIASPRRLVPYVSGGGIVHATSGTTGTPKLRADDEDTFFARIRNGITARGECDGPVFVAHNVRTVIGIKSCVTALLSGQFQVHLLENHTRTLAMIRDLGIAHAFIPPIHLRKFVETAEREKIRPSNLRRINAGGGPISPEFAARCEDLFGCEVYNDYGSTETDTIAIHRVSSTPGTPGVAGRIFPVFGVRFVDEDSREVPPDQGGELWLRMPQDMRPRNYPDMSPLCDADGWTSTGDIGRINEEGLLVLTGRKSDLINVGGNKLAPGTFEQFIIAREGAESVAAFKIPTGTGVDDVGIAVVLDEGSVADDVHHQLTSRFGNLYNFHLLVLSEIPRTQTGVPDRGKLLDMYRNSGGIKAES